MTTTVFTDERMIEHANAPGHPEAPDRLRAVLAAVRTRDHVEMRSVVPATREQVCAVHDPAYVDRIEALRGRHARLDADTTVSPASVDAAFLAAGAAIGAVETVLDDPSRRAWALVRPPGHHAEPDRAMGFCLFNSIGVAAAHALTRPDVDRVMVIDWDVHHGNGTQAMFYTRPDVLFFSSHEYPLYPGTGALDERGAEDGIGFNVNVPLPAGAGDALVLSLYRALLPGLAKRVRPDVILVSAGFDAHEDDPLANLTMTTNGFGVLSECVVGVADEYAGGRVAFVLEGGYDVHALAASAMAAMDAAEGRTKAIEVETDDETEPFVARMVEAHRCRER